MPRDFKSNGFGSARSYIDHEDADPRVGLVNLADVMLVFACGLMLALVVNWNIKLPDIKQLDKSSMQEVDNVEKIAGEITSSTNPYMELGKVYQDPATGKLYMMTESQDKESGSDGAAGANAAAGADSVPREAPSPVAPGSGR